MPCCIVGLEDSREGAVSSHLPSSPCLGVLPTTNSASPLNALLQCLHRNVSSPNWVEDPENGGPILRIKGSSEQEPWGSLGGFGDSFPAIFTFPRNMKLHHSFTEGASMALKPSVPAPQSHRKLALGWKLCLLAVKHISILYLLSPRWP